MSFTLPFLLVPVFFRSSLPCSDGYHLKWGGMPLHDAVGINCKKGATTKNQCPDVKYMQAKGSMLMTVCVLCDLARLPLLGGGRKSWYIIIIFVHLWLKVHGM